MLVVMYLNATLIWEGIATHSFCTTYHLIFMVYIHTNASLLDHRDVKQHTFVLQLMINIVLYSINIQARNTRRTQNTKSKRGKQPNHAWKNLANAAQNMKKR